MFFNVYVVVVGFRREYERNQFAPGILVARPESFGEVITSNSAHRLLTSSFERSVGALSVLL
jgi:hypothetical protein